MSTECNLSESGRLKCVTHAEEHGDESSQAGAACFRFYLRDRAPAAETLRAGQPFATLTLT